MGRQVRRVGREKARRRKFMVRRIVLLLLLLGLIVGAVILLTKLFSGEKPGGGSVMPSIEPTIDPMPTVAVSMPAPTTTPEPQLPAALTVTETAPERLTELGLETSIMQNKQVVEALTRDGDVTFGKGIEYTDVKGVTTYGGNNFRNTFSYGTHKIEEKTFTRMWECMTGSLDTGDNGVWTGIGWTGMPVIVEWDAAVREKLAISDEFKYKDGFTEVIYPATDGNIYFFELATGKRTREPLYIGVVMKGTATLDPRGYPLLYIGQGIPYTDPESEIFGSWMRVISLADNTVLYKFGGRDPFSLRAWQAYDGSALVHAATDTLIFCGENGVLYSTKLNTVYDAETGSVSINPGRLEKYKYTATGYGESDRRRWWGMEDSLAVWRNYAFFTDNGGLLQCVDLNTFKLKYCLDVTDNSDGSIVVEEDFADNTIYLYTANTVDKQEGIENNLGKCYHRKLNGLTGEVIWQVQWDASSTGGGTISTPHIGHGSIDGMVIFNMTMTPVTVNGQTQLGGRIIAYDKFTGSELWRYEQEAGYWSSPVVIYDEYGTAYLIQCDRAGKMRMHDPKTGAVLCEMDLGSRVEGTPAVYNNMLVIGTTGQDGSGESQKIIGVRIK